MPQHYAVATVARLLEAANSVQQTRDRAMVRRVVNGQRSRKSRAKKKRLAGPNRLTFVNSGRGDTIRTYMGGPFPVPGPGGAQRTIHTGDGSACCHRLHGCLWTAK